MLAGFRPGWSHSLKLKDLLTDDNSDEKAVEVASELVKRLEGFAKRRGFEEDFELFDIIEGFGCVENCNELNGVFTGLYDWADDNRVWIE